MTKVGCNHIGARYTHMALPPCSQKQRNALIHYYMNNATLLGEKELIDESGCLPPCTLMYQKFEAGTVRHDHKDNEFTRMGYKMVSILRLLSSLPSNN